MIRETDDHGYVVVDRMTGAIVSGPFRHYSAVWNFIRSLRK